MSQAQDPVLLTVRGTLVSTTLESARTLHNETAGSPPGVAAARSLGDLSHKVFAPFAGGAKMSDAKTGELLFLDIWVEPGGIQTFFSNPQVGEQASRLFKSRDPNVWMPARGSFAYHLPVPAGKEARYIGIIRAPVKSPEDAIGAFREVQMNTLREARQSGKVSHQIFFKLGPPGAPTELLGLDTWHNAEGMLAHYGNMEHMAALTPIFAGAPQASIWEQAPGAWSEW
jgi:hypothetical protein